VNEKKDLISWVLQHIEASLSCGQFQDFEESIIERKDPSTEKEWTSLKETICAYLNTNGGYVICGIRERDEKYSFPRFDRKNESVTIDLRSEFFKK